MLKPVSQCGLLEAISASATSATSQATTEHAPSDSLAGPVSTTVNVTGLRVLVAEDNEVNQQLFLRILERQGYDVTVVGDGQAALEALEAATFDCVLMDMQMPNLDGLETTRIIREKEGESGRRLPIIALTAYAMKGDEERCLQAGMDGYISKPIDLDALYEQLTRLIKKPPADDLTAEADGEPFVESIADPHADETPELIGQASDSQTVPDEVAVSASPSSQPSTQDARPSDGENAEGGLDIPNAMRRFGNEFLFAEMTRQFLANYPKMILNMSQAIEEHDHGSTHLIARSLKDLLGMFGAESANKLSLKLEMMAHAGDVTKAGPVLDELEREMLLLAHAIRRAVPTHAA